MNIRDDNGYSLLELLVALALTAVIAAMMVQTARQLHPLRRIQARYEEQEVAGRISAVIAEDVGSALNLPLLGEENRQSLIGTADTIRFVAVVRTGFRMSGLREVTYRLGHARSVANRLVRTIAVRRFGKPSDGAVQIDNIANNLGNINIAYLNPQATGGPLWQNRWDKADNLPTAVRIELKEAYSHAETSIFIRLSR